MEAKEGMACADKAHHRMYPNFADMFGHDLKGHRAFNAVIRHISAQSEDEMLSRFAVMTEWQIRDIPTVGSHLAETVLAVQKSLNEGTLVEFPPHPDCGYGLCIKFAKTAKCFTHDADGHRALSAFLRGSMRAMETDEDTVRELAKLTDRDIDGLRSVGPKLRVLIMAARDEAKREGEK